MTPSQVRATRTVDEQYAAWAKQGKRSLVLRTAAQADLRHASSLPPLARSRSGPRAPALP
jgi:hypothetical protein